MNKNKLIDYLFQYHMRNLCKINALAAKGLYFSPYIPISKNSNLI